MQYVAFLRGINVGGKMVKMEALKTMLEEMGFTNVKTLLNSGNVVFDKTVGSDASINQLRISIEEKLALMFGFLIHTIVHTRDTIKKLVASDPFKDIIVDKNTRLYITFLSSGKSVRSIKLPYQSPEKDVRILRATDIVVISVITLSSNKNTTDFMKIVEKEFGKNSTTRNWNTVLKVSKLIN